MGSWFKKIKTLDKYHIMPIVQITHEKYGDRQQKIHFTHHRIEKLPTIEIWVKYFRICK